MLAHAMSSTNLTAPKSSSSAGSMSPTAISLRATTVGTPSQPVASVTSRPTRSMSSRAAPTVKPSRIRAIPMMPGLRPRLSQGSESA